MKDISLDQRADKIGTNPFFLSKSFKQVTGKNFIDYLTESCTTGTAASCGAARARWNPGTWRLGDSGKIQIAGLDRLVREDDGKGLKGKDALFLLDADGRELWKEERTTAGWLTIIEPLRGWTADSPDYILADRRGGGLKPALYDGRMQITVQFPADGYAAHADLLGSGTEQVLIYDDEQVYIYGSRPLQLAMGLAGKPLPQPKRLSGSTLYPGGEVPIPTK